MILIVTAADDSLATHVESLLRKRGAEVLRFDTADFPSRCNLTIGYRPGVPRYTLRIGAQTHRFDTVDAVWYRKPGSSAAHAAITDNEVRQVLEQDCAEFLS